MRSKREVIIENNSNSVVAMILFVLLYQTKSLKIYQTIITCMHRCIDANVWYVDSVIAYIRRILANNTSVLYSEVLSHI